MALEEDDHEDLLNIDAHRISLLEIIEDRNRALNKKTLIHRAFIISTIGQQGNVRGDVGGHFDHFFKQARTDLQSESITGLMLIYQRHLVFVVEASADVIFHLAKELRNQEAKSDGCVCNSKILVISHDVPIRQYQGWNFRMLDIVEPGLETYETTDSIENLVMDLLTQLIRLGTFLSKQPKVSLKMVMDSLHDRVPELLPQQAVVHYLLESEDSSIMEPKEYVEMYEKPYDVVLDSDLVWPLPTRLFPYN